MKTFYHNSIYANKKDTVVHKLEPPYDCLIPENSTPVIIKGRVNYVVYRKESEGSSNHTYSLFLMTLFRAIGTGGARGARAPQILAI